MKPRLIKALSPVGKTLLCILLVLTTGCATYSDRTQRMRDRVAAGKYEDGLSDLNSFLKVKRADELPSKWNPDDALMLLERGSVLQAQARHEESAKNLQAADEHLELLDISNDTVGSIGQYIYSDSATKYRASPTEKLALNELNMMNYLAQGNTQGAQVEARRFTLMRTYLNDLDKEHAHGVAGSYLAGFLFEQLGDPSRALRYYDEALQKRYFDTLQGPVARLASKSNYRGKEIDAYHKNIPPEVKAGIASGEGTGEILTVVCVGRVPHKTPERVPIGAVVGLYGSFITGDIKVLSRSVFKTVVYPELVKTDDTFLTAAVEIDGKIVPVELMSDLSKEIKNEYEKLKPKIIGAAISRMIARAAAAEVARYQGRKKSSGLGELIALTVEGLLVVADKPDTRSWTLLPGYIYVSRERVPAGPHTVEVGLKGGRAHQIRKMDVDVPKGGFATVVVTTLR